MKIDILANDGSPLGVTENTIYGRDGRMGVGGAELAILTLCRGWHDAGHIVTFYNDPSDPQGSVFTQRNVADFRPHDERDILIIFRSPNERIRHARGKKIWFSCDQFTVGDFKEFSQMVDRIVTISPFHAEYFEKTYGITGTHVIDLPVRLWEYEPPVKKIPKRCIFTSIPDRGLEVLHAVWPRVVAAVPDASLVITSDWRLWVDWATDQMTLKYRMPFARVPNVTYLGAINRGQLIGEQLKAELHLYPCIYDELFCISVAESQVAGAWPITSETGAVKSTNMGTLIPGNPYDPKWVDEFIEKTVYFLNHPGELEFMRTQLKDISRQRFSLERILKKWDEVFK